jgi:glutamyl/glutaminyl-tRNA synthetase
VPQFATLPPILRNDRTKKLGKRDGAKDVLEYRSEGYLPEAFLNYLVLIGWNPGDDREVMTLEEIVAAFDLEKVQKGGAVFDEEKLKWMNKQYMMKLSDKEYLDLTKKFAQKETSESVSESALPVIRDRAHTFGEIPNMFKGEGELSFVLEMPAYDAKKLSWKGDTAATTSLHIEKIIELLSPIENFSVEEIKKAVWPYAEEKGKGNVLWPMRFALTGRDKSPDPFISASILGKEESIERLKNAVALLKSLC